MKELGITKGETFALRNQPVQRNGFYIETNSAYIGEIGGGYLTLDQYRAIGELLIDGANTAQKCGLLPSELLRQRDELKEALEEQKRLYFNLFDEDVSCMYCEVKLKRGSAIILCKGCAESTEV
jgi:hypothetical protein